MARIALDHPGKTVIVRGMFNHVSFASSEEVIELRVMDVVPPRPSKLLTLLEKAFAAGLIDLPVVPVLEEMDLNKLERGVKTDVVIFPCRASGMLSKRKVLYLDETPKVEGDATLVGCDLSRRIFKSIYKKDLKFVNMCARDLKPDDGRKRIVKCCKVRDGFEIEGETAIVPWGATVKEVADAVNALLRPSAQTASQPSWLRRRNGSPPRSLRERS
jgi:hypothetical protein